MPADTPTADRPRSVQTGTDAELLAWAAPYFLRKTPRVMVDTTWGRGRFWRDPYYCSH